MQVDVGIAAGGIGGASAYFKIDGHFTASVDEVVAIRHVLWKRRAVICTQCLFARIGDQREFARQDVDELIFAGVPMPLAGPRVRWQAREVDAEIGQSARIAQCLFDACAHSF